MLHNNVCSQANCLNRWPTAGRVASVVPAQTFAIAGFDNGIVAINVAQAAALPFPHISIADTAD